MTPTQLAASVLVDSNLSAECSEEYLSGLSVDLALVLGNNALPCPVCTTNLAWGLETSHGNLIEGAKPYMRS
jgi:hypothetical protein